MCFTFSDICYNDKPFDTREDIWIPQIHIPIIELQYIMTLTGLYYM